MAKVQPAPGLGDPYKNPELFKWLDSLEGVPDWLGPAETDAEREGWSDWQRRGNRYFALAGATMPGVALALLIALAGRVLADLPTAALGLDKTPISPILVAILLGLLIRNAIGLPDVYEAGLQLALKKILRIGVALLGIRLSLYAAGSIGLMQLRPFVAKDVARRHGLRFGGRATLFDPGANVRLGTIFLSELIDRFGDPSHAIAAYNAGPTRVGRLLDRGRRPPQRFVNKVRAHYETLRERYSIEATGWGG